MDKRILCLFNFVVLIFAKVEWKVDKRISAYGENLRLFCTTEEYSIDGGKIKRWEGGPKQKMLTLNGAPDQEDVMKYKMSMLENGFDLVINKVTIADLNVTYECTYGFQTSGKVLLKKEDAFEVLVRQTVKPSKGEREGTNTSKFYVIPLSVLAVVAIIVILLIILHRKGKLKDLKGKLCGIRKNTENRSLCFNGFFCITYKQQLMLR